MLTLKRLVLHGCAAWLTVVAIAPQGFALEPWPVLLDSVKANPDMKPFADVIVDSARQSAALPIIKRAHALAEVGSNRTWLDGRSNALEDEIREDFALAMSDFAACNALAEELPLLAAAYRLTDDSIFLERTLQQLREMAAWSPLQRPGWSLYAPGNR
ncbi:MAG: hypothetical protein IT368_12385 [Candidatus Hydrogenedentes bacterium]|nr:hypothetical protein [Candidatus Hydrogenedentota bacterium]